MWLVPKTELKGSLSVGKLRRAVMNARKTVQLLSNGLYTSTSLDGLGGTLPPPMTNIWPFKVSARVSPVALGMGAIVPILLVAGLKLNELVVSITVPPE
jgi:hypothetical protein